MYKNLICSFGLAGILLSTLTLKGQSPGGVPAAAWYRADLISGLFTDNGTTQVTDNSPVYRWDESTGKGFNFLQATSGARPVFSNVTNLANFNPTLTFDGSNDWMQFTAGTGINIIDRAEGSLYAAGFMNVQKRNGFLGFHPSMDYPGLHTYASNFHLLFFTGGPGYQGQSTAPMAARSFFTAGAGWRNGAGASASYAGATVSLNGNRIDYAASQLQNANLSTGARDLRIGGDNNYGAFSGQLNEILVFEDKLTIPQMDQVETYLAIKYGTTYASGGRDYKNSTNTTVWNAAANTGWHNNIAGIARDNNGALYQKQSWSTNQGQQVLIGVGSLANTNAANIGSLTDGQYLIWGDNGLAKTANIAIPGITGISHRFAATWKVQNSGAVGTVRVAWPKNLINLKLIQSADAVFDATDNVSDMSANETTINGIIYNYVDVILSDGQYFTFGAKVPSPGGVVDGLLMWHKADDGVVTPGAKNKWQDVSGNGRDVAQNNNATYQPLLVTDNAYKADNKTYNFNFNPFYYFDGTNDFFYREGDLYFPTVNSPGSTYGVMFNSGRGGWNTPYGWADDDPNFFRWDERYELWRDNGRAIMTTDMDARTLPANIGGMSWRGNNINGVYMNLDGKTYSSTTTHIGTLNNNRTPVNFAIGSEGHNVQAGGNEHHQGGISEVFAYSVDHQNSGGDEKQRINSYLAVKYGITLKTEDGLSVPNYLNSSSTVVWDATANTGYNKNIAGLARDESSALHQKQSQSNIAGQQVLIGTTGLANTNALNTVGLAEGQWLLWGDNGLAKSMATSFIYPGIPELNLRFAAIWKVQNTGNIGAVRVCWPSGVAGIHLIQSADAIFDDTDPRTDMTGNTMSINGVVYNYADVTLPNGEYFTFAGYVVGPGNVASAAWYRADAAGQLFSDAGTTAVTDGQDVQQWNEYRGTGHNFSQYGGQQRPRFSNETTLANFNPTVTFYNNARLYYNPDIANQIIDRANGSLYAAGYVNTVNQTGFFGFNETNDDAGLHIFGPQNKLLFYTRTGSAYTGYSSNAFSNKSYFTAGAGWQNGITNLDNATVSLNGIRTDYTTADAILNVLNTDNNGRDMMMGLDGNTGALNGQLNEMVVFEHRLDVAEMDRVETYMSIKYGTTFANGTRDYKNAMNGTVWNAALNTGYHHNIAGIGRDDLGSLSQKQSWSTNTGRQVLISTTGLANTNAANTGVLSNGQYLVWGDNNLAKGPTVIITGVTAINKRFAAIWKVQNTGSIGTVRVAWPSGLTNMKLVQSSDDVIDATDVFTDMTGTQLVNGITYSYADVTLSDGQYFTFAAYVQAPGGVTNGLSHWYRADKLTESAGNGTNLVKWTDFTSGVVTSQLGTGALPQFKTGDSAYFNFNPGINFTNANQSLGNISEPTLSSLDFDIFTLTKEGMAGTRFFNIGMNNTTLNGTNWDHPGLYTNGTIARRDNTGGSLGAPNPGNINFLTNVSSIMYHKFTNTSMSKGLNGNVMGAIYNHTARGPVTGGFMFGSNAVDVAGGDDAGFTGNIGELIIYGNGTITAAERNKVDAYLAIKYGITLQNSNNYTTSQDVIVWDAAANTGFYNNVAGIGHDFNSALLQKQSRSQHANTNGQVIMALGTIAPTNEENTSAIADGKFLIWGDNGNTQAMTNTAGTFTAFSYAGSINNGRRMNRVWKVQNTGIADQLFIRFPQASVGTTTLANDACADYAIIFADDAAFTTNVTAIALTLNGTNYEALHSFPNGASYFTFGRVTPLSTGTVYLPEIVETTGEYNDNCGTGEWAHFNKTGDPTQKLLGLSGIAAPELSNLEVTITPEGVGYSGAVHTTNLMPRIASIVDNNASPVSSGKLRVYYSADEMNATNVPAALTSGWFRYDGSADDVIADVYEDGLFTGGKAEAIAPDASGIEDGIYYVEFHNVPLGSSFVYLSSTQNLSAVLPVTLLSFTAQAGKSNVILKWATSSEQNNKGFEIERSADGNNWSRIDFVGSKAVNGNSSNREDYAYADNAPLADKNYYRLKQIDLDGRYKYSPVSMATFSPALNITVAPNPVVGELRIEGLKGKNKISITNISGQVIRSISVEKDQILLIDMSRFVPGVYFLSIQNENGSFSRHKVLKR
ncbi:T9SS type A sorting domain-containing protein [Pseudobacter ginsenosidimutans]|uniref:Putative secreted protein (Por secretion system target) n=1 Tax=Pseudobacter ginsenosidimutans TaxID=661488 RepID=A0A4Q7MUJ9_9BACT|nr:T9SS type A sorting domain-containing protein [Pseudobacter ginsenosidimutans]QEC40694.1 T9SS type A sorting domain-containing protein [Pseudobacter ginsenosidimutans]RZS72586.1 putative secreted protein (Por secretion system target) [Pseudobacter ginsenosidimutans]